MFKQGRDKYSLLSSYLYVFVLGCCAPVFWITRAGQSKTVGVLYFWSSDETCQLVSRAGEVCRGQFTILYGTFFLYCLQDLKQNVLYMTSALLKKNLMFKVATRKFHHHIWQKSLSQKKICSHIFVLDNWNNLQSLH